MLDVITFIGFLVGSLGQYANAQPNYSLLTPAAEESVVIRETPAVLVARLNMARVVSVYADYDLRTEQPDGTVKVEEKMGCGAGIIIDSRGYIVTCGHVVGEGRRNLRVRFFGRDNTVPVTLIGVNEVSDVAVVKVIPSRPLDPIVIGSSKGLVIGETVYAIGNPHNHTHTFSVGIISARPRKLAIEDSPQVKIDEAIQMNASVQPGNSGGVLLNGDGEMIGMSEAAFNETISFATPVEVVIRDAKRIMKVQELQ